jgi:hypothetical protein
MGSFRGDRFEAAFVVTQPPQQVWESLQVQTGEEPAWLSAWPRMPGFERTGHVTESEAPRRLGAHKDAEPCKDTEIEIVLEPVAEGTRVQVVQSGFPAWVQASLESFVIGGNQIIADLVL